MKQRDLAHLEGQPVRITWEDANSPSGGWMTREELTDSKLSTIVTVTHLVSVTQRAVHTAADIADHGDVACTGLIPLGWILKVEPLMERGDLVQ